MPTIVVIIDSPKALFGSHLGGFAILCRELKQLNFDKYCTESIKEHTRNIAEDNSVIDM